MINLGKAALCVFCLLLAGGCDTKPPKIGVSFHVGPAMRWQKEKLYMEERAASLGVDIEVRLATDNNPETQLRDCAELLKNGARALVVTGKYLDNIPPILEMARKEGVGVIAYSRPVPAHMFYIGYDSVQIGRSMSIFLTDLVHKGDYIILRGDSEDANSDLIYFGVRDCLSESGNEIRIILDEHVPGWSSAKAKAMVKKALSANGGKVDAILAFNDNLAGAALEALAEAGITAPIPVVGCDATLEAVRRIARGRQAMTIRLDFRSLAYTAVDEALRLARGEDFRANSTISVWEDKPKNEAFLLPCQEIVRQNIVSKLVEPGYYTYEEIYADNPGKP